MSGQIVGKMIAGFSRLYSGVLRHSLQDEIRIDLDMNVC